MAIVRSIGELSKKRIFGRPSFSDPRHAAGAYAEKLAAKFLRKNGYKILYRNFVPTSMAGAARSTSSAGTARHSYS